MLGRLLKNVRLRCDWSLWWAVVGLATKMSRGAGGITVVLVSM